MAGVTWDNAITVVSDSYEGQYTDGGLGLDTDEPTNIDCCQHDKIAKGGTRNKVM